MQHSQLSYICAGMGPERALWAIFPLPPCAVPTAQPPETSGQMQPMCLDRFAPLPFLWWAGQKWRGSLCVHVSFQAHEGIQRLC